jgi:hypothetical protein
MLSLPAWEVERPFFDLKVFGRGAGVPADSRNVACEEGIDHLITQPRALKGPRSAEFYRQISRKEGPWYTFSSPCGNDQANHELGHEQATGGVMA